MLLAACGGSDPEDLAGTWELDITSVSGDCFAPGFTTSFTFVISKNGSNYSIKPPELDQTPQGVLQCSPSICGGVVGFSDPDGGGAVFQVEVNGNEITGTGEIIGTPENPTCSQGVTVLGSIF